MVQQRLPLLSALVAVVLLVQLSPLPVAGAGRPAAVFAGDPTPLSPTRSGPALVFVENAGQFAAPVRFQVWGGGPGTWWLAEDALWLTVARPPRSASRPAGSAEKTGPVNFRLSFAGANPHPRLEPFERQEVRVSYFFGADPAGWRANVPMWGGVRYVDLYPGVDLEVAGEGGRPAWRFVLRGISPSADPSAPLRTVRLRVEGAERVAVEGGRLRLAAAGREFDLALPQVISTDGSPLEMGGSGPALEGDEVVAPFAPAGSPATAAPVEQESADLLSSTYIGGSGVDRGTAIAVNGEGAVYVAGTTDSPDFPATPGAFRTQPTGYIDTFVVKLDPTLSRLEYATFLGGSSEDGARGIAVDGRGAAYVVGRTGSADFPTTPGAFDRSGGGGMFDGFVVKLAPSGAALEYATFLGENSLSPATCVAVDNSGAAYVAGSSSGSDSSPFPTTPGAFDTSPNGGEDAFVAKLDPRGSALIYATLLGGNGEDEVGGIAVDGGGAVYIAGETGSNDFPTTPGAADRSLDGPSDAFVTRLNPRGSALEYATLLGGRMPDGAHGIALDGTGAAYVAGETNSEDFPVTPGAFDTTCNATTAGAHDNFVVKLNAAGSALEYGTFLGGGGVDRNSGIAVGPDGKAVVLGYTESWDFPLTRHALDSGGGYWSITVTKLDVSGSSLEYSGLLGGSYVDGSAGIALGGDGTAYLTGYTESTDFPTTAGAYKTSCGSDGTCNSDGYFGSADAFVARMKMEKWVPRCPSGGPTPAITLSRQRACTGIEVVVSGSGFPYAPEDGIGTVEVRYDGALLATVSVKSDGTFYRPIEVPPSGAGGMHTITASDTYCTSSQASATLRTPRTDLPIIIIHGVSGSTLVANSDFAYTAPPDGNLSSESADSNRTYRYNRGNVIWLDEGGIGMAVLKESRFFDALRLNPDGATPYPDAQGRVPDIVVGQTWWNLVVDATWGPVTLAYTKDIYGGLRDYLIGRGYQPGQTLFYFPYDWRKDVGATAADLERRIDEALAASGRDQVVIVAHSMGGLVARNYLLRYGTAKVDQVITIGTPYLGAPKVAKVLELGDDWGVGFHMGDAGIGLHPKEIMKLAQNFPSAYELSPSPGWFNPDPLDPGFSAPYIIRSRLEGTVALSDMWDMVRNPQGVLQARLVLEPYGFAQTQAFFRGRHNSGLVSMAETFHLAGPGDLSRLTDQYFAQRIIGTDLPCLGQIIYSPRQVCAEVCYLLGCETICKSLPEFVLLRDNLLGDGTVPLHSALGYNTRPGDDMYYFVPYVEHVPLPGNASAQRLLGGMLDGEICSNSHVPFLMVAPGPVNVLLEDSRHRVWAGTGGGVSVYEPGSYWRTFTTDVAPIASGEVTALLEDSQYRVWVGTDGGVSFYDPMDQWHTFNTGLFLVPGAVTALLEDTQQRVWVGTEGGVSYFNRDWQWLSFESGSPIAPGKVNVLLEDSRRRVWVGTEGGVSYYDPAGQWHTFAGNQSPLAPGKVNVLLEGSYDEVWVGTEGGVSFYDSIGQWHTFTATYSALAPGAVHVLLKGFDGRVWVGTDGGVSVYGGARQWQTFTSSTSSLPSGRVNVLMEDFLGRIWAGTDWGVGFYANGSWQTFTPANSPLAQGAVRTLLEDSRWRIWVGTEEGISVRELNRGWVWEWRTFTVYDWPLAGFAVNAMLEDSSGWVWAGMDGGVSVYDKFEWWRSYTGQDSTLAASGEPAFLANSPAGTQTAALTGGTFSPTGAGAGPAAGRGKSHVLASGTELVVIGSAALHLYDSAGRHTGLIPGAPHGSQTDIPGVGYEVSDGGATAMIVGGGIYTVTLTGSEPAGAALLRISRMEQGTISETLVFEGIPITTTSVATLTLDTSYLSPGLVLRFRYDRGRPEETIGVAAVLGGAAGEDMQPPLALIQIGQDRRGTLSAQDEPGGSGVARILYSTEDTPTRYESYVGPFPLPEGARSVSAIAIDRAGNAQYPATRVVVPQGPAGPQETRAGTPLLLYLGLGGLGLVVILIVILVVRRRHRPKQV